jgi:hypothetical protein
MPVPPARVTSSAVSSMVPGITGAPSWARKAPYVLAGSARVDRPVT